MLVIESDPAAATVALTATELRALNNALNEVCNGPDAIEDWEFPMRMGVERGDAMILLSEIGSALRR